MEDDPEYADWFVDYRFHKELHLTLNDINNMCYQRRFFYIGMLNEIDDEERRRIDREKSKMKQQNRRR